MIRRSPNPGVGSSFLEIVAVVVIVAVAMLPLISALTTVTRGTEGSNTRVVAITLASAALERFRAGAFLDLKATFGSPGGAPLASDAILRNDLLGQAFLEESEHYQIQGQFEEQVPGQLGLLTFRCRYPTRRNGPQAEVRVSKVILDYTKVGWGSD